MTTRPTSPNTLLRWAVLAPITMLALAACGSVDESTAANGEVAEASIASQLVVFEEPRTPGDDPFTATIVTPAADEILALPEDARPTVGPGLYGGTGDNEVCDRQQLVHSLSTMPTEAAAWADVRGVDVDEIDDYVDTLTPAILAADTRVTNHGFDGTGATPFQSTLAAGTAVLVGEDGKPVTRCACGNPLDEPISIPAVPADPTEAGNPDTGGEFDDPTHGHTSTDDPGSHDLPDGPTVESLCDAWDRVRVDIEGGPSGPGLITEYLIVLRDGLNELISAAEATPGLPEDGLADLILYHGSISAAVETGGVPGPGDVALRDRVEDFLLEYCDEPPTQGSDQNDDSQQQPQDDALTANCGSMQFLLLIAAADGLGLDHSTVSTFYLQTMQAVLEGADPGEEFDVGDLTPMIAYEEVGCAGAQAMRQLFEDANLGHMIEGTELDG